MAYTLCARGRKCRMVLGYQPDLLRDVIATIRPRRLHQSPVGWLAGTVVEPPWGKPEEGGGSEAAMACALQNGVLDPLLAAVPSGDRVPGTSNWPTPFLLLE